MVKGTQFKNYRKTGLPKSSIRIFSAQDADELLFLDIDANKPEGSSNFDELLNILSYAAEECFIPLAAGGGIDSIEKVRELLKIGADKVVINSATVTNPQLINKVVDLIGSQSLVAAIDYKYTNGVPIVWTNSGSVKTKINVFNHALDLARNGAGELMLNCIDRDGMMAGADIELVRKISAELSIPVIACGGIGNFSHIFEVFNQTDVSAVACGSLFHFGDNSPIRARSTMKNLGIEMRSTR
jgi:imidazole glycerol-phosphate synthase subunit HisF